MVKEAWLDGVTKQSWDTDGGSFLGGPPKCVLHSTETISWPGYASGATAPHLTAMVDSFNRKVNWRQHIPLNRAARALRNESGGVQTNRDSVVQIELVGTTDPNYVYRNKTIFWPEAPDWVLDEIGAMLARLADNNGFKLVAPKLWVPYPHSYGKDAKQRMSASEWENFNGVCAHQHVPENSHGDVLLNINRILQTANYYLNPPPKPVEKKRLITMFVTRYGSTAYRLVTGDRIVGISKTSYDKLAAAGVPAVALDNSEVAVLQRSLVAENCTEPE